MHARRSPTRWVLPAALVTLVAAGSARADRSILAERLPSDQSRSAPAAVDDPQDETKLEDLVRYSGLRGYKWKDMFISLGGENRSLRRKDPIRMADIVKTQRTRDGLVVYFRGRDRDGKPTVRRQAFGGTHVTVVFHDPYKHSIGSAASFEFADIGATHLFLSRLERIWVDHRNHAPHSLQYDRELYPTRGGWRSRHQLDRSHPAYKRRINVRRAPRAGRR